MCASFLLSDFLSNFEKNKSINNNEINDEPIEGDWDSNRRSGSAPTIPINKKKEMDK